MRLRNSEAEGRCYQLWEGPHGIRAVFKDLEWKRRWIECISIRTVELKTIYHDSHATVNHFRPRKFSALSRLNTIRHDTCHIADGTLRETERTVRKIAIATGP